MRKNLKKVIGKIYKNAKEKDVTKRTFKPDKYHINWARAVKEVNAKGARLEFNKIFKTLFVEILTADLKAYLASGHKLTYSLKKKMTRYAKEKAKDLTKTKLTFKAPAEQSYKEQEGVLTEG